MSQLNLFFENERHEIKLCHPFPYNKENDEVAKPFLKWAGGKRQLLNDIEQRLPEGFATMQDVTYVEPFIGGGAVLFWILQKYPNITNAVINDINTDLTRSYLAIRDNVHEIIRSLWDIQQEYYAIDTEAQRLFFYMARRDEFNTRALDDVRNTTLMIFLNRTCFNGMYRVNSQNKFNIPFGKHVSPLICDEKTLRDDSELLQRVTILNGDFSGVEKHITTPNAFLYFDPPYKAISKTASFNSYAADTFNDASQVRLKEFCDKMGSKGYQLMLSNSDVKNHDENNHYFDDLYSGYNIDRVMASRSINSKAEKRGKVKELLITNY